MKLKDCNNVADLRKLAKRNLPWPIFNYMDGGADDELTLGRNTDAFNDYELLPSQLSDVSSIDMKTTVLGQEIEWPVFLAPTGASRLFHHESEPAVVRAEDVPGLYVQRSWDHHGFRRTL
jgi:L-lactate dehydrogenase (cytochrome)